VSLLELLLVGINVLAQGPFLHTLARLGIFVSLQRSVSGEHRPKCAG
jgi:hypothetical protein